MIDQLQRLPKHCLLTVIIINFFSWSVIGQSSFSSKAKKAKELYDYSQQIAKLLEDFNSNRESCLSQGYSADQCDEAATLCATYDYVMNNAPGIQADMMRQLQLFEAFKPVCGDGLCFQCCYSGGICHSSFVGFPVINCNTTNYSADTKPVGMALVIDPTPGQACLFTQQICTHIAACHEYRTPQQIENINNNPNHELKSQRSLDSKARDFGNNFMNFQWAPFLNELTTNQLYGNDALANCGALSTPQPDSIFKVSDVYDFLSARGNIYWREWIDSLSLLNLDQPAFGIYDTLTNELLEGPTQLNFVKQLGLARLLASVPNLRARLDFTGSYIWTDSTMANYFSTLNEDPDVILQQQMSQLAYHLLKANTTVQDHRLLAVPLQGEIVDPNFYGGDPLGKAAILQTHSASAGQNQVDLTLSIFSPGTHNPNYDFDGITYWGDGTVTEFKISNFLEKKVLSHTYRTGGYYQAFTILLNSTGLRALKYDDIYVQSNTSVTISETPIINEIWFPQLKTRVGRFTFTNKLGIKMGTEIDGEFITLGQTGILTYGNGSEKYFDTLALYNNSLIDLDSIVIKPSLYDDDPSGAYSFMYTTGIRGLIYKPDTDTDNVIDLPFELDDIIFYDQHGTRRTETIFATREADTTRIYFEYDTINMSRIVIPIDKSVLRMNYIEASTTPLCNPNDSLYIETRPGYYDPYLLPDCNQNVINVSSPSIESATYNTNKKAFTSGTVQAGSDIEIVAGESILMMAEFCTKLGGIYEARIGVCTTQSNLVATKTQHLISDLEKPIFTYGPNVVLDRTVFYFTTIQAQSNVSIRLVSPDNQQTFLINEVSYDQGNHRFVFERDNFPSGFYQLVIEINNEVIAIEKLVLL